MEFDLVNDTVTYFLDDVQVFFEDFNVPFASDPLDETKGLTYLFIQNSMNQYADYDPPVVVEYPPQSNVTFIDNLFYSATITGIGEATYVEEGFENGSCGPIGDINCDGRVDAEDLGLVRTYFGVNDQGDADGDGLTDAKDLGHVRTNFGQSAAPTPEPATMGLLALGGLALCRRPRCA